MRILAVILLAAAIGGGAVFVAMRYGQETLDNLLGPVDQLTAFAPEPSPTATPLPANTPLPSREVQPAATPIPTRPGPTATPIPPTLSPTVTRETSKEMAINAFAECNGQYSGRDKDFRATAVASAINDGRQTVRDIQALVNQYCEGIFSGLEMDRAGTEEMPTVSAAPTPIARPTALPTRQPTPTQTPSLSAAIGGDGRFSQEELQSIVHRLVNAYRKEHGLQELRWDTRLAEISRSHSLDMAANDYYRHLNHEGDDPSARARKANYDCHNPLSIGIAENIHLLYGHTSSINWGDRVTYQWVSQEELAGKFVDDWTDSAGHRRNILDRRYTRTGIGIGFGTASGIRHGVYITQNFC